MAETKTWLTPKRLARGPEAANEELRRWAKARAAREQRPTAPRTYHTTADMRRDESASRSRRVGSVVLARDTRGGLGLIHVAVGVAAVGAGFLVGRWWARRRKVARATTIHGDTASSSYARGLDALAGL